MSIGNNSNKSLKHYIANILAILAKKRAELLYISTFNFKNLARFRWALKNLYGILCLTIIYGGKNGNLPLF